MPERIDGDTGCKIEIPVALLIDKPNALAFDKTKFCAREGLIKR